jgi:hypothetical protein
MCLTARDSSRRELRAPSGEQGRPSPPSTPLVTSPQSVRHCTSQLGEAEKDECKAPAHRCESSVHLLPSAGLTRRSSSTLSSAVTPNSFLEVERRDCGARSGSLLECSTPSVTTSSWRLLAAAIVADTFTLLHHRHHRRVRQVAPGIFVVVALAGEHSRHRRAGALGTSSSSSCGRRAT